ncbi:MAG TPA: diguanylate cyclase [Thermoleophilia bacterium]|nr:diguanylate cyclase [Thermoleophilia bacterium]
MDVLIAHGTEGSRRSLATSLGAEDLQLREATDGPEALEALLHDEPPRVALIDWDLPRIDGPELCRLVRDFHIVDPPYILLLAGPAHHDEIEHGLSAGAHDCVRTPVTSRELQARVEMARRVVELPWGRREMGDAPGARLSGVLGPTTAVQLLDGELARARREGADLSIGVLDVDGLSLVDETCGRAVGDAVLKELVGRVRRQLRPYDVLGRLDGEEFLIIVSRTTEDDVTHVLDRVHRAATAIPYEHDGRMLSMTVSLGGATGRSESAGELIAEARVALGEAKAGGTDRVVAGPQASLEALLVPE